MDLPQILSDDVVVEEPIQIQKLEKMVESSQIQSEDVVVNFVEAPQIQSEDFVVKLLQIQSEEVVLELAQIQSDDVFVEAPI